MRSKWRRTAARGRTHSASGWICGAALVAMLAACGGGGGSDSAPPNEEPPVSNLPPPMTDLASGCEGYASENLPHGAKVTETSIRAASGNREASCVVKGEITEDPTSIIKWAVELPEPSLWNGKSVTQGGGAFDGFIPTDGSSSYMFPAANRYVRISSDSGHQTRNYYPWAIDDVALKNHASEANHKALQVGIRIAEEAYGRPPEKRYMIGHSNGGRSGLAAAQKYPSDYHGIVALEPAISQQAHEVNVGQFLMRHIFSDPDNWMNAAEIRLFADAEIRACDGLDGLEDGIIGYVEACDYIPDDLLCPTGVDNDTCLTAGQIETIRRVYSSKTIPVMLSRGKFGYPRFGRGGAATSDWRSYLFGSSFEAGKTAAFNAMVANEAAKVAERNESATLLTHDPTLYQGDYTRMSAILDTTDPDLSAFHAAGGKLLVWYGVSDTCVSVYETVGYLASVERLLGTTTYRQFTRFLASPHLGHGRDGPGAASIDFIGSIERWVEDEVAPDNVIASKIPRGGTTPELERPVCEWPKFPRYNGSGDPTKADSFTCSVS